MATVTRVAEGLIPVLVGLRDPTGPDVPPAPGALEPSRLDGKGIDWAALGTEPRWVGMESSDCAAALHPGIYHSDGARERDRYIAGAARRGETAVLVSVIGNADGTRRNPLSVYDASVSLSLESGSVCGRRLPQGAAVGLAGDLNRADRDLALRLKNRPSGAWWSLKLEASEVVFDGSGGPLGMVGPDGNLAPILADGLGNPVVAVWTSPELDLRWYVVPFGTDWPTVIDWLVQQALPAYVPGAQRRVRSGDMSTTTSRRLKRPQPGWRSLNSGNGTSGTTRRSNSSSAAQLRKRRRYATDSCTAPAAKSLTQCARS